jgi:hypothetical protein
MRGRVPFAENAPLEARGKHGAGGAPPRFFVSVAFKGVSFSVSLFFAILVGRPTSVAAKGVTGAGWR